MPTATEPLYWPVPVPVCTLSYFEATLPEAASVTTCSSLGVPSSWNPSTTDSQARTGLDPAAAQTTSRGLAFDLGPLHVGRLADRERLGGGTGRGDLRRGGGHRDGGAGGLGRGGPAVLQVQHQVTAEDRESRVGALVPGVGRAVGVLDDVLDDELLPGAEAELLGRVAGGGGRALEERGALGG